MRTYWTILSQCHLTQLTWISYGNLLWNTWKILISLRSNPHLAGSRYPIFILGNLRKLILENEFLVFLRKHGIKLQIDGGSV